ncbi:histidinol-phosphate transaminase [Salinispirillum marinum]|uniref:Histidinol-phosphate aminotransferase n=2 Tax=Saccharospirillaceae TaxID=255527 RepID=A0ABV8BAC5_9GAMM
MSQFWSEVVRNLDPYVPGEQPQVDGLIKLNTNESPYPPSPRVQAVLQDEQLVERLRLYPDPNSQRLKAAIAKHHGVDAAQVLVGNGSDEVLALAFMAFFQQPNPLLFPDISYSFYPVYCQLFGITAQRVALQDDLSLNLQDFVQPNGGVIFPNPNAPTGRTVPLADIEALLQANTDTVVLVDEAYVDFGAQSAVALVSRHPNLLVCQTLSKSRSLAGLRVGFAIGSPELIEGLDRVKNSFNSYPMDRIAEAAAVAAIEDETYFAECCQKIMATRAHTTTELEKLGFSVLPSSANFVFAKPPVGVEAATLAQTLREHKIIVRYFNKPRISEYLRITIGTDEEMDQLLAVLHKSLG